MHRFVIGIVIPLFVPLSVAAQDAPEDEARARIHFEAGRSYFEEGAYEQAADEFQRAHALSGHAELLMNTASSLERLGRWAEAADLMERYLADADQVDNRPALERRIENLRRRAAGEVGVTDEGGGISGRTLGAAISFGVGGAGLALFGVLGALALAEHASLEDGCGATTSCGDAEVSGLRALNLGADIGLGVAALGAIAGVLVLLLVSDDNGSDDVAGVSPWFAPDGAGVTVRGAL
jgi:tetratricopeptide (TPR) repeat protein